jgi:hypothetical protein
MRHPAPPRELHGEDAWSYELGPEQSALDIVRISRGDLVRGQEKPIRYALFFGEHGRELISTEVGIHLLKALCGRDDVDHKLRQRASQVLSFAEVLLFPNIDESGRRAVEDGQYCQRQNLEHVDLNRNWDYKWGETKFRDQGKYPFSESETRIARKHLEEFNPNVFLSVHSGDRALWTPGAYDFDDGDARRQKGAVWDTLLEIADNVNDYTHCNCKIGAPGKLAHKHHPGTSIDYVGLKMDVPYAMAWEIWLGKTKDCLGRFNPLTHAEYNAVLSHWSTSMVYFAEMARATMRQALTSAPMPAVEAYSPRQAPPNATTVDTVQNMELVNENRPEIHGDTVQADVKDYRTTHRKSEGKPALAIDREDGTFEKVANRSAQKDTRIVANAHGKLQRLSSVGFSAPSDQIHLKALGNVRSVDTPLLVEPMEKGGPVMMYCLISLVLCIVCCIGPRSALNDAYEHLVAKCKDQGVPSNCNPT